MMMVCMLATIDQERAEAVLTSLDCAFGSEAVAGHSNHLTDAPKSET